MKIQYKVKGKAWKLMALKGILISHAITSYTNFIEGSLTCTCKDNGELVILQSACNKLELKYHQL